MRAYTFNLVINHNAECYDSFKDILKNECKEYHYILHDDNPAQLHYHVVLRFCNQRYDTAVRKLFLGAHVEICKSFKSSVCYLIHKDNEDKKQYSIEDICTSDRDLLESYLNLCANCQDFPKLTEDLIFSDIKDRKCVSIIDFYKKYGFVQVRYYRVMILDVLQGFNTSMLYHSQYEKINKLEEDLNESQNAVFDLIDSL